MKHMAIIHISSFPIQCWYFRKNNSRYRREVSCCLSSSFMHPKENRKLSRAFLSNQFDTLNNVAAGRQHFVHYPLPDVAVYSARTVFPRDTKE
jgi:hypothetical protein